MPRRCTAVATLLLLLISTTSIAQQSPLRAGETIDVSIVNVDVVVTDKQGNRVRGLTRDDFEIVENGKRQPLSNFAEYRGGDANVAVSVEEGATPAPRTEQPVPREKRTIVIFFEVARMPHFIVDPLVSGIRQTVQRLVGPGDTVSFIAWDIHAPGFTEFAITDSELDDAFARVAKLARGIEVDQTRRQVRETEAMQRFEAIVASRAASQGMNAPGMDTGEGSAALDLAMTLAYGEMQKRVNAVNSAITTLAGVDGKKIMILIPRRFSEVAGAEILFALGADRVPYALRQRFGTASLLKTVADNANANGVTIYPIYPPGMAATFADVESDTQPPPAADYLTLQNETTAMNEVARQTGGLSTAGIKNVVELLPRIADDVSDYYSLGYRITTANADRTRDVVVKVRNRDLVVRARRQHVEKSEDTRMRDRLITALFRPAESSDIPITAEIGARKRPSGTAPVSVRVPIGALTMLPQADGKYAGSFSVYVGAAAELGAVSDVTKKTQPFEIAEADVDRAKTSHFTYELDLNVNKTAKYVAVAVYDEVGRTWGVTRLDVAAATP